MPLLHLYAVHNLHPYLRPWTFRKLIRDHDAVTELLKYGSVCEIFITIELIKISIECNIFSDRIFFIYFQK